MRGAFAVEAEVPIGPVVLVDDVVDSRWTLTYVGSLLREWLERVLLRLGPDAEVVSPLEARDVGKEAARRLLARYEAVW